MYASAFLITKSFMPSPRWRLVPLKYFINSSLISGTLDWPLSARRAATNRRTPPSKDSQSADLPIRMRLADPDSSLAIRGPQRYRFSLTTVCSYRRQASTNSSKVELSPDHTGTPSRFLRIAPWLPPEDSTRPGGAEYHDIIIHLSHTSPQAPLPCR